MSEYNTFNGLFYEPRIFVIQNFKLLYYLQAKSILLLKEQCLLCWGRRKKAKLFRLRIKETYLLVILLKPKSVLGILKWQQQLDRIRFKSLPVKWVHFL